LRRQAQYARRIACEIANGRIELRERYFHARTQEYGWNSQNANRAVAPSAVSNDKLDQLLSLGFCAIRLATPRPARNSR
jgi:hypothetical protein